MWLFWEMAGLVLSSYAYPQGLQGSQCPALPPGALLHPPALSRDLALPWDPLPPAQALPHHLSQKNPRGPQPLLTHLPGLGGLFVNSAHVEFLLCKLSWGKGRERSELMRLGTPRGQQKYI